MMWNLRLTSMSIGTIIGANCLQLRNASCSKAGTGSLQIDQNDTAWAGMQAQSTNGK